MYLSKIEIIGFKSFAQRVNVNFDSGVTAIVGPNGCGKTNIVDAIRWALGEQRYSTLRSDKMEDVIFNGTKTRKPLGLAEVSLTIENTKGILPTDYSEVTITRRVFRSGESEYLLNKVPCRLKDIIDLFMDTGMGSDAYSVIELKMVESILSDKTDERRRLFEEAAGVTKYKSRRKAAVRKLQDVQQDLARVNDIVKEVQKTVNSLERQAKKAEQYNEVSARLKALEIDLLEREYAYLHGKLLPLEEKYVIATTDKTKIDETLRNQEEQVEHFRDGLTEIEKSLSDVQRSSAAKFEEIHRTEEKILVANERQSSLTLNIERFGSEVTDLQLQQESLQEEQSDLKLRLANGYAERTACEATFQQLKDEYQEVTVQLETKKTEVSALNDEILRIAHDLVEKRGEHERLKTRIDNNSGRIDRATEDNELYRSDITKVEEQVRELTAIDKGLRSKFAEAEMNFFNKQQSQESLKREIEKLRKRSLQLANEIDRKRSKVDLLQRMLAGYEGFSEGTKFLLTHEHWKQKHLTTVADIIQSDEKYRAAIEGALAEFANVLVVETIADGFAALTELKQQDKGKTSFICLDSVPIIKKRKRIKHDLHLRWASEIVKCDERYRPLVNVLLDDVAIVDTLDAAVNVFALFTGVRCISTDGQIVSSSGFLRGGSRRHDEGGIISKKTQIEEIEQEIQQLQGQMQSLAAQEQEYQHQFDAMSLDAEKAAVKSIEKEMAATEMRIAQLEFEKKRANDGIDRNSTEIEMLNIEITELKVQRESVEAKINTLEEKKKVRESVLTDALTELEKLEIAWDEKTKTVNEYEIRVVTIQGEIRNTERDIERAEARLNDVRLTMVRRTEEIARAQEELARLGSEVESHGLAVETLRQEFEIIEQQKRAIEETYARRRNELHQIELRIKDERRLHDDSVSVAHDLEMKIAEIKSNIEHIKLRAKEEFELELEIKQYPEDEWVDFAHLREEVKNLKDRIRVLGAINFAAFDEFTTESERLTFLTQQRDDLIEAEKTLMDTIEEINNTAQRKFLETFGMIRANFIMTFKELFMEGDECDLKLEEDVDPLEANIEIVAKPRGKRPTSIDLLSGGEKTLTAIALLFSIYLVKPSPFCILDEVDAPLDDSNIDRYTRILKKFSNNTQFIVVTHNKRTMEAASALYGITMEEEGISKIVTVRFNEEARVRSATVTN
jgi:chromosome segregation protein